MTALNVVAFYAGWLACVVGAAHGHLALGPAVVAILVGVQVALSATRRRDLYLVSAVGALGWCIDTAQASLNIYSFGDKSVAPWLCPLWMMALWVMFATTLNHALGWLADRPLLAALLGAVAGPLSYYSGARLGAIALGPVPALSLAAIALVWGLVMPALFWLAARIEVLTAAAPVASR